MSPSVVSVIPLEGLPELEPSDDLALLLHGAAVHVGGLEAGDVVVVAQKAVSKVEGRVVALADVEPSERAIELAGPEGDPRQIEVILWESAAFSTRRSTILSSSFFPSTRTHPRAGCASGSSSCPALTWA